jgi:hypothetical protein
LGWVLPVPCRSAYDTLATYAPRVIGLWKGDALWRLWRGAGFDGRAEESLLETTEVPFEFDNVEGLILTHKGILDLLGDLGVCQDPSVGSLGLVVTTGELASVPDLFSELHDRLEVIGVQAENLIEHPQELELPRRVVAVVADCAANDGIVFLLDIAVVVLVIGPTAGEGDFLVFAVLFEVGVDELGAVVGVEAQERKGESGADSFDGGKNMATGLIFRGFRLGPACGHIGQGECLAKVPVGTPAVVSDEIDLAEARTHVAPVSKRPDGNVVLQERPRTGGGASPELALALGLGQETIHSGCAGRDKLLPDGRIVDAESPLPFQQGDDLTEKDHQALATEPVRERPESSEGIEEGLGSVPSSPVPFGPGTSRIGRDKDHTLAVQRPDLLPPAHPEDIRGITPCVPAELNEVVQDLRSFFLPR